MPQKKRSARPGGNQGSAGGPRRLGGQPDAARPQSSGAARRAARNRKKNSSPVGWIAIGVVIVVLAVFLIVHFSSNGSNNTAGQSSGRDPVAASAAVVSAVENVPTVVYNQVGTDKVPAPFELVDSPALKSGGKDQFVYYGAEYCPYCALMRWSLVASLSRFGTFTGLKQTMSADSDGDIPTFSFLGAKYTSKYLVFTPTEAEDRNRDTLQTPAAYIEKLVEKYDFPPYTTESNEGGIPFLDVGNKYIAGGDSEQLSALFANGTLVNGGPGRQAIADSLDTPFSQTGTAAGGPLFDSQANYLSATICMTDGAQPSSVCTSSGVKAAEKALTALKVTK